LLGSVRQQTDTDQWTCTDFLFFLAKRGKIGRGRSALRDEEQ
jgi:hypothetical protein